MVSENEEVFPFKPSRDQRTQGSHENTQTLCGIHKQMCTGAGSWSCTHRDVGACKTSPAEEVNKPVEAGQPAATLFLPFSKGGRLNGVQVIDWSHHPNTCHKTLHL